MTRALHATSSISREREGGGRGGGGKKKKKDEGDEGVKGEGKKGTLSKSASAA